MRRIIGAIVFSAVAAFAAMPATGWTKTAGVCAAEWKDNKAAIKAAGQKKKDFIADCRADKETIPGAAATTPSAPPAASAPAPVPQKMVTAPPPSAPTKANQFSTEAQAKGRCPTDTVVWVNTRSGVYHFVGFRDYGTTKSGVYMCEADTAAAGFRAAKNEKHP